MITNKFSAISSYIVIDMNNKIIFQTMNSIEAKEKFVQLKDDSPNVHIVLAEVRKEFKRENGEEITNEFV